MEKTRTTRNGSKSYSYWMASWHEGNTMQNIHIGGCVKMDAEAALQKAIALASNHNYFYDIISGSESFIGWNLNQPK
ncbi:Uncharacterised protein [uncultured archaeon]|nr:Uncharacterised protein [uncultured archaeon]